MELTEFNLCRQYQGESTRRQCHFAESLLFWRGYWPWQRGDAEFALINAEVPLQSCSWVFFVFCLMVAHSLNTLEKMYFHWHQCHHLALVIVKLMTFPSLDLVDFVKAFIQYFYSVCTYVTCPLTFLWTDALNVYCVDCCTAISVSFLSN